MGPVVSRQPSRWPSDNSKNEEAAESNLVPTQAGDGTTEAPLLRTRGVFPGVTIPPLRSLPFPVLAGFGLWSWRPKPQKGLLAQALEECLNLVFLPLAPGPGGHPLEIDRLALGDPDGLIEALSIIEPEESG